MGRTLKNWQIFWAYVSFVKNVKQIVKKQPSNKCPINPLKESFNIRHAFIAYKLSEKERERGIF